MCTHDVVRYSFAERQHDPSRWRKDFGRDLGVTLESLENVGDEGVHWRKVELLYSSSRGCLDFATSWSDPIRPTSDQDRQDV